MAQTQDGCLYSGLANPRPPYPAGYYDTIVSYRDFALSVKDSRPASRPASALNDAFLQSVESFEGSSGDVLAASNYKRSEFEVLCAGPHPAPPFDRQEQRSSSGDPPTRSGASPKLALIGGKRALFCADEGQPLAA